MLTILKGCASAPLAISLPADHGGQGATLSVHFQTVTRTLAVPDGATSVAFSLSREETAPLALGVWPVKICLVSAGGSRVALVETQKIRVTDCPDEVSAGGGGIVLSDAVEKFAAEAKTAADAAVKSAAEAKASAAEADASAESAKAGLGEHLKDFGNPHQVTASQVGAYTKGETDEAIKAETDRAKAAVLAKLSATLQSGVYLPSNLINGVQHYAKQTLVWSDKMNAWGAEWSGDYIIEDGTYKEV